MANNHNDDSPWMQGYNQGYEDGVKAQKELQKAKDETEKALKRMRNVEKED